MTTPSLEPLSDGLALLCGDIGMYGFEANLSSAWTSCYAGDRWALRVIGSISELLRRAAEIHGADAVMVDLGPSLGAINRATLLATDAIVIPLHPDFLSVRGLSDLGKRLNVWGSEWKQFSASLDNHEICLPTGQMNPIGYVITQVRLFADRYHRAVQEWFDKIPSEYRTHVLGSVGEATGGVKNDEYCLGILRHYHSLMGMALESHKPMFHLKPADGAIGAYVAATHDAYQAFKALSLNIARRAGLRT
jgi:hypothetical protein